MRPTNKQRYLITLLDAGWTLVANGTLYYLKHKRLRRDPLGMGWIEHKSLAALLKHNIIEPGEPGEWRKRGASR